MADVYAQDDENNILSMAIPKDAKIINYQNLGGFYSKNSISSQVAEFIRSNEDYKNGLWGVSEKGRRVAMYLNDSTFQAVELGYDVVEIDPKDWLEVLSNKEEWEKIIKGNNLKLKPHYIILNRSKIIVIGEKR